KYSFTGIGPGTYRLREQGRAGWLQTSADPNDVPAQSGQDVSSGLDFGTFQRATFNGHVVNDLNGNGSVGAGEPGLAGWTVNLLNDADGSPAASATTDSSGSYSFPGIGPGTYRVAEVTPAGWLQTPQPPLSPIVPGRSGQNVSAGLDFTNFQPL